MKTLYNNKGIALIVLIISMTLIAVLGASFVAFVGTKQKGFLYQRDSYRALNIANAGVEYAIRYVGDNINPTPNTNDFYHNANAYPNVPVVSSQPDTTNLNTSQWKKIDFPNGSGSFYLSYYLNTSSPDDSDNNKILYSVGVSGGAQRIIKLRKFLAYASPSSTSGLDKLNLVPNNPPYISGRWVVIPIMNVYDATVAVTSIKFELNSNDSNIKRFEYIYFNNSSLSIGSQIYDANSYWVYFDWCNYNASPPCYDIFGDSTIHVPDAEVSGLQTKSLDNDNAQIGTHQIRWFFLRFRESGISLKGTYTVTFYYSGGSAIIKFSV